MSQQSARPALSTLLQQAAQAYQATHVIGHCTACTQPCCKLETLVLELEWPQVKVLWQVKESKAAFDRQLDAGAGPIELRAGNGRYYAHSKPCPAYDLQQGTCQVYGQAAKPAGCSDFPIYEDAGCVMADLRCEAVNLPTLERWLRERLGPEYRILQSADRDFPFLVTLSIKRQNQTQPRGKQHRRRP